MGNAMRSWLRNTYVQWAAIAIGAIAFVKGGEWLFGGLERVLAVYLGVIAAGLLWLVALGRRQQRRGRRR